MTLEAIKTIVQTPACCCLTFQRDGRHISRSVTIWAIWDAGECTQGQGAPEEPILATNEGWVLLHDVISLSVPQSKDFCDTEDALAIAA